MSSGKSYSLVGVQDTDKAIKHTRLSADERKRLSSRANWKPLGAFSIAGGDSRFLILIRSVLVAFTKSLHLIIHNIGSPSANILNLPKSTFAFAKRGNGSSLNVRIRSSNAPLLSPLA